VASSCPAVPLAGQQNGYLQRQGPGRQQGRPFRRRRRHLFPQALDLRSLDGFPQVSEAGDDGFLYRVAQVLPSVKAVCYLDDVRYSPRDPSA